MEEAGVPADEVGDRGKEGSGKEAGPAAEAGEDGGGEVKREEVGEEKDLMVATGREQQRRGEASGEGVGGEEFGVLRPGHPGVPGGDEEHGEEGGGGGQQVEELQGGPEGEVEDAAAEGFEREGEGEEAAAAEALGPEHEAGTGGEADEDAADGTDPLLIDGEFEEPGGANEDGDDADAVEDLGAEAVFERGPGDGWRKDRGGGQLAGEGRGRGGDGGGKLLLLLQRVEAGGEGGELLLQPVLARGELLRGRVGGGLGGHATYCTASGLGVARETAAW